MTRQEFVAHLRSDLLELVSAERGDEPGQQPSLNLGAGEEEPSTRSPPPGHARARRSPWAWRRSAWACEHADGGGLERLAGGGGGAEAEVEGGAEMGPEVGVEWNFVWFVLLLS
ncbi:uncharacterized protein [Aegilops tauschii subsp. strangulata]|uniref:uncharacterized protein isoform X2 n=1 Tax=Aegilops tauschii subsp. strangulata TaxID=200361 RepID=UPI003CC88032